MDEEVEKLRFVVDWYDKVNKVIRPFMLTYYLDGTAEMYDIKFKRRFLRRSKCDTAKLSDLFIGGTVNILHRQLMIKEYGDKTTIRILQQRAETVPAIIKSSGLLFLGKILDILYQNKLQITRARMMNIPKNDAPPDFYDETEKSELLTPLPPGPIVILECRGQNCFAIWEELLGVSDANAPQIKLLAKFGDLKTHCVCPSSRKTVDKELEFLFPFGNPIHCNTPIFINTTCCVIKPHALRDGSAGKIIQDIIDAGFRITAFEMFVLDRANSEEFCEVYKGVVHDYRDLVGQMAAGSLIAMEIASSNEEETHKQFRQFVGPSDPEIARQLRPYTLRAKHGIDKIRNSIHCTDLPEDTLLEVEYFFKVLSVY